MSDFEERINYYASDPNDRSGRVPATAKAQARQAPVQQQATPVMTAPVQTSSDDVEIDLVPLLRELLHKWWIIAIAALLCGAVAFLVTKYAMTPKYTSDFSVFVSNKSGSGVAEVSNDELSNDDMSASQKLVQTYAVIITSRSVLTGAAIDCGLDMTYDELQDCVSTEIQDETQIIKVKVTTESPQDSLALSRSIEKVAKNYIESIISGSSMEFPDSPQLPEEPSSPNVLKNTAVGILLGILIAAAFIIIRKLADKRIHDEADLENMYHIPVIGTIPDYKQAAEAHKYSRTYGKGGSDE